MSAVLSTPPARKTVLAACPHDCPDTCSMLVTVEGDRVVSVKGNPDHPFTDGRLCVKVNHYEERVHHADRVLYPLKRSGPKGSGQFTRITWAAAHGRDRLALEAAHPAARPDRDPALQLSGHRGNPQRHERGRSVLQQARRHHHRAHLLRLRRLYRLHDDGGPDAGHRPRELRALALHHPVGLQHHQHQHASLAHHRRGAEARREGRRGGSRAHAHRAPGRLAHRHQARHRRRARHGDDERDHHRGSGRQGVRRELHRRLRRAGRARAAVSAGEGGCDHRHPRRRHPQARARIRHDAPVGDPHRRGGRAARRRRPDGARADLPARAGGRVARRRRRHPAASHLGVPGEVGEPDAPGLDQAGHARAEPMEAGRRAHRRARARSTDPVAVRLQRQPGGGRTRAGEDPAADSPAKICSPW